MALNLDKRQRAMLAEMGVRVWWPLPAAPEVATATAAVTAGETAEPVAPVARTGAAQGMGQGAVRPLRSVPAPAAPARHLPPVVAAPQAEGPDQAAIATMDWPDLQAAVAACRACTLCERRTQTVFGVGAPRARWMVIGEAPGEQEDRQGEPFVGPAGQLLDQMLAAIGVSRQADAEAARPATGDEAARPPALRTRREPVFIANVLKCRPPGNRNPQPDEMQRCEPFLRRQVALVQPHIILAMGRFAVQSLLQTNESIARLRGRVHHYAGVPVVVTYHPAYLLRSLPDKAKAWQDLVLALETLGAAPAAPPAA